MASTTLETFTAFFDGWLVRHRSLQQPLLAAAQGGDDFKEEESQRLIDQVLNHYHQYYQEKSKAIEEDVFLILSPPWYTSFEQTLFWVAGFRPSLLFRLISDLGMTAEQAEKAEEVKAEVGRKEREIGAAMAAVQERMAAAPLYGLMGREERLVDGEVSELADAMEEIKAAMKVVMGEADSLRLTAANGILEVLSVAQRVKFLAAVGEFHIRARAVGLGMDISQV